MLCVFNSINKVEAYDYDVVYFYDPRQDSPYTEQLIKMFVPKFALARKKYYIKIFLTKVQRSK